MYKIFRTCDRCDGSGIYTTSHIDEQGVVHEIIEDPCNDCQGAKYLLTDQVLNEKLNDDMNWIIKKIKKILQHFNLPEE